MVSWDKNYSVAEQIYLNEAEQIIKHRKTGNKNKI
jgi:hypothetical protein